MTEAAYSHELITVRPCEIWQKGVGVIRFDAGQRLTVGEDITENWSDYLITLGAVAVLPSNSGYVFMTTAAFAYLTAEAEKGNDR